MNRETVAAERFVARDAAGRGRGTLTVLDGLPTLVLAEGGNKVRISAAINPNGAATVFLAGSDGIPRMELCVDAKGTLAGLRMYRGDGKQTALLGTIGGQGFLALADSNGDRINLSGDQLRELLARL